MALELVPGANFRHVPHHFSSLIRWNGSWGQAWPGNDRKTKLKSYFVSLGLIATQAVFLRRCLSRQKPPCTRPIRARPSVAPRSVYPGVFSYMAGRPEIVDVWAGRKSSIFGSGRKSAIFWVWAAPAAPNTIPEGWGLRPPPSGKVFWAAGAAKTPKSTISGRPKNHV